MPPADRRPQAADVPPPRKAGPLQVAATIIWGLFAIGRKGTWHKDGATITLIQAVVGALVGLVVVVALLIALVLLATH
ncbi:MAG TPA: hypothetical protein VNF69_08295 [Burkholderiales bacterium]|nr:hypothetical protein [Burkholderiales bacterium]